MLEVVKGADARILIVKDMLWRDLEICTLESRLIYCSSISCGSYQLMATSGKSENSLIALMPFFPLKIILTRITRIRS